MEGCGGKDMRNTDRGGEGGGSEYPKRQNDGCRCFIIFFFSTPLVLAISRRKVKAIYAAGASSLTAPVVAVEEPCVAPRWWQAHWGGL